MEKVLFIFDFDGTIVDSMYPMIHIINKYSDKYGYKKIENEDIELLKKKKPRQILKYLKISLFKLPVVVRRIRADLNLEVRNLKPAVDYSKILRDMKKNNCILGILTSNSKENVQDFLKNNNLEQFDFIYSGQSVFGKSKLLRKIKKDWRKKVKRFYYVADEIRDIDAAKSAKVNSIAVGWGFNSIDVLKKEKPDHVITNPEDLVGIASGELFE